VKRAEGGGKRPDLFYSLKSKEFPCKKSTNIFKIKKQNKIKFALKQATRWG
jgi:hypothetical protein